MKKLFSLPLFFLCIFALGQSKTIEKFREKHPEDQHIFLYKSTLGMLNNQQQPEFTELVKDIDKIIVLQYEKQKTSFDKNEILNLTKKLEDEGFVEIMILQEAENKINLYVKKKRNKTTGFSAVIENNNNLVLIDIKGSLDFTRFMELKKKIDIKL
jgi:hypothetical protein